MRRVKLVTFLNEASGFGMSTGIPFSPKDVLLLFNLLPGGLDNIDTFYNEDVSLFVRTMEGTTYEFDSATKRPKSVKSANSEITFSGFIETKNGVWPSEMELKAGAIFPEAKKMIVKTKEIGFNRETSREYIEHVPGIRMAREFDIRQQILQNR